MPPRGRWQKPHGSVPARSSRVPRGLPSLLAPRALRPLAGSPELRPALGFPAGEEIKRGRGGGFEHKL